MSKPTSIARLTLVSILLLSLALLPTTNPLEAVLTTNVLRAADQPGLFTRSSQSSRMHTTGATIEESSVRKRCHQCRHLFRRHDQV